MIRWIPLSLTKYQNKTKQNSSVVEFLVAMGFAWEWAALTGRREFRGLTVALVPLHSSGITACISHVFYNQIHVLVPLQALLTCLGNATAAYAAWRICIAHPQAQAPVAIVASAPVAAAPAAPLQQQQQEQRPVGSERGSNDANSRNKSDDEDDKNMSSLVGFEDLGEALRQDSTVLFLGKLLVGTAVASYVVKYGGVVLLPLLQYETNPYAAELALFCILLPSLLNAYKWYQRGQLLSQHYDDNKDSTNGDWW
jgi:hypothetical protein